MLLVFTTLPCILDFRRKKRDNLTDILSDSWKRRRRERKI